MVVVATNGRWEARASFDDRFVLKQAGWRWDPDGKTWWTAEKERLEALANTIDVEIEEAPQLQIEIPDSWEGHPSCATDGPADIPCPPGLAYLPYQRGGIAYARGKDGVLIADEMGLGKTIQAIGIMNDQPVKTAIVLCPASLKVNWQREIDKWLNYYLPVMVVGAKDRWPSKPGVVIINYDILKKFREQIAAVEWDVMIADESHYLKSATAKRTQLALGVIRARRRVFLSGTPAESRPSELFTVANALRPDLFPSWMHYAYRYCDARMTDYGLEARGSSNVRELQALLRGSIMVRRMKKDVLKDLPAKIRRKVILPCASPEMRQAVDAEMAEWKRQKAMIDSLRQRHAPAEEVRHAENMANAKLHELRVATTKAKMPMVMEFLRDASNEGKVIVFAKHHIVLEQLEKEFKGAAVIHGKVPVEGRQVIADRFQKDPECNVFIGQIQAAGVGLTLTASSHVIFVEFDWRPGLMQQAEDRAHRIGQRDSVLCSYLLVENSLDDVLMTSTEKKQETLRSTLDV